MKLILEIVSAIFENGEVASRRRGFGVDSVEDARWSHIFTYGVHERPHDEERERERAGERERETEKKKRYVYVCAFM